MSTIVTNAKYYRFIYGTWTNNQTGASLVSKVGGEVDFCGGSIVTVRNSDPSFRLKLARKQNASQPYSTAWSKIRLQMCTAYVFRRDSATSTYRTFCQVRIALTPSSFPSISATIRDQALTKIKRKVATHVASFKALIPIAEIRELHGLVKGSAQLTTGFLESLLEIRKTKGLSAYKYASSAWLTYNFGMAPLIRDTQAACLSLSDYMTREDHTVRLSSGHRETWVSALSSKDYTSVWDATFDAFTELSHELSYRFTGGVQVKLASSIGYGVGSHMGFNINDVPSALWETTYLSWIADYFGTFGDFLEDTFTIQPVNTIYFDETRKYHCYGKCVLVTRPTDPVRCFVQSTNGGSSDFEHGEFERKIYGSSIPGRILRFRTADEIGKHSISKLLNLVALCANFSWKKPMSNAERQLILQSKAILRAQTGRKLQSKRVRQKKMWQLPN